MLERRVSKMTCDVPNGTSELGDSKMSSKESSKFAGGTSFLHADIFCR